MKSGSAGYFPSKPALPVSTKIDRTPARCAASKSAVLSPIIQDADKLALSSCCAFLSIPIAGLRQSHTFFSDSTSPGKPLSG